MDWITTLQTLTQASGVSGGELPAATAALPLFSGCCDARVDRNQNMVAVLRGTGGEGMLLLDAHLDEIGLIVTGIDDAGFVSVGGIGGILGRSLLGSEVLIHGRRDVYGVIGATPPHLQSADEKKSADPNKCRVDTGYTKEQLTEWVALGDLISFVGPVERLANDRVMSKAMDDRACCAILARVAELLAAEPPRCGVTFVLSGGEEVNARGATTAAFAAAPDRAIVLDVTFAKEPGSPEKIIAPLGSGPAIGISPILNRAMFADLKAIAEKEQIPYTAEVMPGRTGTNAEAIAMSRAGVPTAVISLPLRYMHTPGEVGDLRDLEACARLVAAYARSL